MKRKFIVLVFSLISISLSAFAESKSVARQWNEMILQGIRKDYARPTVAARNLFHISIAMYDSWALYDSKLKNYFIDFKVDFKDIEAARNETIAFASYRIIQNRYAKAPKSEEILSEAKELLAILGYDPNYTDENLETAAGIGNTVAKMILTRYFYDGAREEFDYATPANEYPPLNPPIIVKYPGVGDLIDVNFWQPMALDFFIDQGGFPSPAKVVRPLGLHWGRIAPFGLKKSDLNSVHSNLYLDPGPPPMHGGVGHDEFVDSMEQVIKYGSWLDPKDLVEVDISPASFGNNTLGENDGHGHELNPVTQKPYESQIVPRGDYARVLAEFWADGPQSETPPGHWNVMANYVTDQPSFKRQWMASGPILSAQEWDVKMYLTLNGALHDAAVTAWGIKGFYQSSRPITAIRYLAELGLNHPLGFKEREGLIKEITSESTQPGGEFYHLIGHEGEVAVRGWLGATDNPANDYSGVDWMLASKWVPYQRPTFVTPPFPGYVSGHSTFSRAGAEVMTAITGDKYFPGGMAEFIAEKNNYLVFEEGPSQTVRLQWATYYDAADQCSLSRIFGGIHGYIDDFPGRRAGSVIGKRALAKVNELF